MSTGEQPAERLPVKSADRTIGVLEALARADRPVTLTELQRDLSYPKSSLYMLLRTLIGRGWVETDRHGITYSIGVRALLVGTSYLDRDPVVRAAAVVLEQVRAEINETVHLARLDGADVVYLASRESLHHLRFTSRVGRRQPAWATALGRAVLSMRDDGERHIPDVLAPLTKHTVTSRPDLLRELEDARLRGYADEKEQNTPGLGCVAVPLLYSSPVTDAISASVPLVRLDETHHAQVVAVLSEAARRIVELFRQEAL
ncbi:IclR family transcriptional regulator [Streptosporangium sp. V21-05]|uniref:IclR family transcriptional regulator n=1 Tax=Streptosporangium sp. V21-05 TaxID=3446115 RepID=UPI003F53685A